MKPKRKPQTKDVASLFVGRGCHPVLSLRVAKIAIQEYRRGSRTPDALRGAIRERLGEIDWTAVMKIIEQILEILLKILPLFL